MSDNIVDVRVLFDVTNIALLFAMRNGDRFKELTTHMFNILKVSFVTKTKTPVDELFDNTF